MIADVLLESHNARPALPSSLPVGYARDVTQGVGTSAWTSAQVALSVRVFVRPEGV